jgi:hypothetical protein
MENNIPIKNKKIDTVPNSISTAGTETLQSIYTGNLPINIRQKATECKVIDGITENLISVGKICDNDYNVIFTKDDCKVQDILDNNNTVMIGTRDHTNGMYNYEFSNQKALALIPYQHRISFQNHADITRFWSATLGNPTDSTLLRALKQFKDINIPNLNAEMLVKNPVHSIETDVGHEHLKHQTINKIKQTNKRIRCYLLLRKDLLKNTDAYVDQTGRFPVTSLDDYQYIIVFVHYLGYISFRGLKNRSGKEISNAYTNVLNIWKKQNKLPLRIMLDNEISPEVRKAVSDIGEFQFEKFVPSIKITLVPPKNKRMNTAERNIGIVKDHILSTLAGVDPTYPMKAWSRSLQQMEICLNLLIPSKIDPNLSAYGAMFGPYNFITNPMAPIGTKVMFHNNIDTRESWESRGKLGYYIGPALEHHKCFKVFNPLTSENIISDTISWYPNKFIIPGSSEIEVLTAAINKLTHLITQKPSDIKTTEIINNLQQIQDIYLKEPTTSNSIKLINKHIEDIESPKVPEKDSTQPLPTITTVVSSKVNEIESTTPVTDTISNKYTAEDLKEKTIEQLKEICVDLDIQTRINSVPSTLQQNIITKQNQERIIQPSDDKRKKKKKSKIKVTTTPTPTITAIDDSIILPPKTKPQPYEGNEWEYVTATRHSTREPKPNKHYANSAKDEFTFRNLELPKYNYRQRKKLQPTEISAAEHDELVRLTDETKCFVWNVDKRLPNSTTTYYNPQLEDKIDQDGNKIIKIRGTAGGNTVDPGYNNVARSVDNILLKTFCNQIVSEDACALTVDIRSFYVQFDLPSNDIVYIKFTKDQIPQQTVDLYSIKFSTDKKTGKQYTIARCLKALYGLPQANYIAYHGLKDHLASEGFSETTTKCHFRHTSKDISFIVNTDDFLFKIKSVEDGEYAINMLEKKWKIKANRNYINNQLPQIYKFKYTGITIEHDRNKRYIDLSLPDYYNLLRSNIPEHIKPRHTPGNPTPINYGQQVQTIEEDEKYELNAADIYELQSLVGKYGWYAKQVAIDLLPHVAILSTHQTKPNKNTKPSMEAIQGYLKMWGEHKLRYYASDMILHIIADASHGTEITKEGKHRSRDAYYAYLGTKDPSYINAPISVHTGIITGIPASAAEAEINSNFNSGKAGLYMRQMLDDMGYKQSTTIIFTDNICAKEYANDTIKGTRLRHIDRKHEWMKYMVNTKTYTLKYIPSIDNLADFFTKIMNKQRHDYLTSFFVHRKKMLSMKIN